MLNSKYYQICKRINAEKQAPKELANWQLALIAIPLTLVLWFFDVFITFCFGW